MECVFGLVGDGFAILSSDSSAVHSNLVHKFNEDKIMILDSHKLVAASGEPGDRVQFTEYSQLNVALYQFRNGIPLTTAATAYFTRGELATALRKGCPLPERKESFFGEPEIPSLRMKKIGAKSPVNMILHCLVQMQTSGQMGGNEPESHLRTS